MADNVDSIEVWKDIPSWEGFYQASSEGRIRSLSRSMPYLGANGKVWIRDKKGLVLKPGYSKRTGYWLVILAADKLKKTLPVHVAVCAAFHGPRPLGLDVAHSNGDRSDNRAANLGYKTRKENLADQLGHGTRLYGQNRWNSKLTESDVLEIVSRRNAGERVIDLAKEYSVNQSQICHIMSGKSWSRFTEIGGNYLQEN